MFGQPTVGLNETVNTAIMIMAQAIAGSSHTKEGRLDSEFKNGQEIERIAPGNNADSLGRLATTTLSVSSQ